MNTSSEERSDILVLGATGFTGRLITKYLAQHFQKALFSLALGARSSSKLQNLVTELNLADKVQLVEVDVTDEASIERAVKSTRVVINTVGPYWTWGTPVVASCVRNGVHYVDLTGETAWIKKIITDYDYAATKTGAIIVPSCGYDSVPSDISAWLANKTLKAYASKQPGAQFVGIGASTSAQKHKGGVSGGSISSLITMIEELPKEYRREAYRPYSLSPVVGKSPPQLKLVYELVVPTVRKIVGCLWVMRHANVWTVQRTFGLLEARATAAELSDVTSPQTKAEVNQARYGPEFVYDEFLESPSKISAFITSAAIVIGFALLNFFQPVRALVKKLKAQSGSGPSQEDMDQGFFELNNVSTSTSTPSFKIETKLTGKGDPGYPLSAIMISESALSLLFPPHATKKPEGESGPSEIRRVTPFAKEGGILTPMTAFGEDLITRLRITEKFTFSSFVVEEKPVSASNTPKH